MLGTPLAENVVALSVEMAPLRTADATAALFSAMSKFPKDLPRRVERIAAHMQEALPGCLYGGRAPNGEASRPAVVLCTSAR